MDLMLIRHAESFANAKKLLIASDEDGLTETGEAQASSLAETLGHHKERVSLLYCSPWRRARQTAEILFGIEASVQFDERLSETHPGKYGSWRYDDFKRMFPDFHKDIANRYDGGESHLDMVNRVRDWVDSEVAVRTSYPGLIAMVGHGGPISVVLQYILQIPFATHYPSFAVPNASFTYLRWRPDFGRYCVEVVGHT